MDKKHGLAPIHSLPAVHAIAVALAPVLLLATLGLAHKVALILKMRVTLSPSPHAPCSDLAQRLVYAVLAICSSHPRGLGSHPHVVCAYPSALLYDAIRIVSSIGLARDPRRSAAGPILFDAILLIMDAILEVVVGLGVTMLLVALGSIRLSDSPTRG